MDGNWLQGAGMVLCIGVILIGAVLFMAIRSLFNRGRADNSALPRSQNDFERPRYDSDDVVSRGGFGRSDAPANQGGFGRSDAPTQQGGFGSLRSNQNRADTPQRGPVAPRREDMLPNTGDADTGDEDRLQSYRRQRNQQQPDRDDIDDVTSSGGFGR